MTDKGERAERLGRALRENLRKRKAQARARSIAESGGGAPAPETHGMRPETGPKPDDETEN